jgi:hypothetical protein
LHAAADVLKVDHIVRRFEAHAVLAVFIEASNVDHAALIPEATPAVVPVAYDCARALARVVYAAFSAVWYALSAESNAASRVATTFPTHAIAAVVVAVPELELAANALCGDCNNDAEAAIAIKAPEIRIDFLFIVLLITL